MRSDHCPWAGQLETARLRTANFSPKAFRAEGQSFEQSARSLRIGHPQLLFLHGRRLQRLSPSCLAAQRRWDLVCALTPFGCTPLVGFCAAPCGPSWISSAITGTWVLKVGALSTVFATSTRHGQAIMNRPILTFSMCWNARRSKPPS